MTGNTIPCMWCINPVTNLGTNECDICASLWQKIKDNPRVVIDMLVSMEIINEYERERIINRSPDILGSHWRNSL